MSHYKFGAILGGLLLLGLYFFWWPHWCRLNEISTSLDEATDIIQHTSTSLPLNAPKIFTKGLGNATAGWSIRTQSNHFELTHPTPFPNTLFETLETLPFTITQIQLDDNHVIVRCEK